MQDIHICYILQKGEKQNDNFVFSKLHTRSDWDEPAWSNEITVVQAGFAFDFMVNTIFFNLGQLHDKLRLDYMVVSAAGLDATTALLSVCSYVPYVLMRIFAGTLIDKWNKKATMLLCDSFAALCTVVILLLLQTGSLQIWHLYCLNALNGLMNTVQQPAAD